MEGTSLLDVLEWRRHWRKAMRRAMATFVDRKSLYLVATDMLDEPARALHRRSRWVHRDFSGRCVYLVVFFDVWTLYTRQG